VYEGCFLGGGGVSLAEGVMINICGFFDGSQPIEIGQYTRVGPFARFITSDHHLRNSPIRCWRQDGTASKPITVGRGCWRATGVTILPG
jgi:acetyltransferase-like isoleucine patch superfamily enzyme